MLPHRPISVILLEVRPMRPARLCALVLAVPLLTLSPGIAAGLQGGFGGGGGLIRETDLFTTTIVLTPGESDPWPIKAKVGETIIATVTSTVFDPMVAVIGPDGKTIGENDDIRPGVQDSLLLCYLPKAETYKVIVKSMKSRAGGQYTLTIRRFVAVPTAIGQRMSKRFGDDDVVWHRFDLTMGQPAVVTVHGGSNDPALTIFKPSGQEMADVVTRARRGQRAVFRAETKGTYYARIANRGGGGYAITVALAREFKTAIGQPTGERKLEEGGLDIWRFAGKAGDLVSVTTGGSGGLDTAMAFLPPPTKEGSEPIDRPSRAIVALPADPKIAGKQIALLNETGDYVLSVSHDLGVAAPYSLSVERVARAWPAGQPAAGELELGASHYWVIEGTPGKVLRVQGESRQFDAEIELYDPRGSSLGSNDDGAGGRSALLTVMLTAAGKQIVRMHAHGDGGSGAYKLTLFPDVVKRLAIGQAAQGKVGAEGSDIYSFTAKAGQTVVIAVRSAEFSPTVTVYGPDGLTPPMGSGPRDSTDSVQTMRCPLDGVYTVWVVGREGSGSYSVRVVDVP